MTKRLDAHFEALYQEHYPMVKQMSLGFAKANHAYANDLTQEVFVNVWRALSKFNQQASHKTWIYRITVNTCLNSIRDSKNDTYLFHDDVDERTLTAMQPESCDELYRAIGKLEELDRLIIMMVLDETAYGDIAQILGIKEGTLRVRIHRAKKQLQELLRHDE